jgi:hypothetical protein
VPRAKRLLKVAAILSSLLLVSGFILYRVRAHVIDGDEERGVGKATFLPGTKQSFTFPPEATTSEDGTSNKTDGESSAPTQEPSSGSVEKRPLFLPGTKQSPVD